MDSSKNPLYVGIAQSAMQNPKVDDLYAANGRLVRYASARDAERDLSVFNHDAQHPVVLDQVSTKRETLVDAVLRLQTPNERVTDGGVQSYATSANQKGAIGEALICAYTYDPPVLTQFVKEEIAGRADITTPIEDLVVELDANPDPVHASVDTDDGGQRTGVWVPDCAFTVHDGRHDSIASYLCEIKAGSGRLERDQKAVMEACASDENVLLVNIDLDGLPERYTASVAAFHDGRTPAVTYVTDGVNIQKSAAVLS